MKAFLLAASAALPVLALAQGRPNDAPITPPSSFSIGPWIVAILVIAVIGAAFFAYLSMRQQRRRNPPHGPQAPTPRGP